MNELENYTDAQLRAELVRREHQRKGVGKVRCMDCKNLCSERYSNMTYRPKRHCNVPEESGNADLYIKIGVWRKCNSYVPINNENH